MLGAWPIEPDRLKQYVRKALREAKTHTSWINIDEDYESRVLAFVDSLYSNERFLKDFTRLQKKLAYFGALSSLSQLILKITSPGVPDFYRGTEVWDLSLADPDNRRPVDFRTRIRTLEELRNGARLTLLLKHWPDGRVKMAVSRTLLTFRRSHPELFQRGDYVPLHVSGARADHVIAFVRRLQEEWCVVAVPRLFASLRRTGSPPVGEKIWQDTRIELPPEAPAEWTNILTGETLSGALRVADLFRSVPFAVLSRSPAD
jgi:(1->4)-alpha-D-glucan 1-alpha-D-glucosylmutase